MKTFANLIFLHCFIVIGSFILYHLIKMEQINFCSIKSYEVIELPNTIIYRNARPIITIKHILLAYFLQNFRSVLFLYSEPWHVVMTQYFQNSERCADLESRSY